MHGSLYIHATITAKVAFLLHFCTKKERKRKGTRPFHFPFTLLFIPKILEIHTEVHEERIRVNGVVALADVGDTKLVAGFEIEVFVLSTTTQLEAHVGTLQMVESAVFDGAVSA